MNLKPSERYEPSSGTKKEYPHTPKEFKKIADISVHGLFSTHGFDKCCLAFAGVILIEIITLYIYYSATGGSSTFILVAIFAVVDFILAILSHYKHNEIIILLNQIAITEDPVTVQKLEKDLKNISIYKKISIFLIWVIMTFKTVGFYSNYLSFDVVLIIVGLLYFLEAWLHAKFTGYIWYTVLFNINVKREHDKYVMSGGRIYTYDQTKPRHHLIISEIPLIDTRQGKQSLQREDDTNKYHLNVFGMLTDAELLNLANDQDTNDQIRVVLKEGIKFQLEIINLDNISK